MYNKDICIKISSSHIFYVGGSRQFHDLPIPNFRLLVKNEVLSRYLYSTEVGSATKFLEPLPLSFLHWQDETATAERCFKNQNQMYQEHFQ